MKCRFMLLALLAALPASAGNVWLTLNDGKHELVKELGADGGLVTVLEHSFTVAFGESPTQIALISHDQAAAQNQLRVIAKETRQVLWIWPVAATPVQQASGPAPDIVLVEDAAYLLAHTMTLAANAAPVRNERGGMFNVLRIALRTGETTVLPLGKEFRNPRLANFDGVPLVTDWAGYAVWRLASDRNSMTSVIEEEHLADILRAERSDETRRKLPFSARADFVAVPGAGVFRMSRFGRLHRVAGAGLEPLPAPHASLDIGPAQNKEMLLAATSQKDPAIAVVRRTGATRTVTFIDALSLSTLWERELPQGASPWSMLAAGADTVLYIENRQGSLVRTSRDLTSVLRLLPADQVASSRVLSAGLP
jgi:hypothetical protein